ncbi:MAG: MATE family efflux transporter [Clostridia bacterium]|nr:MATE family efflux transporter [Clostridia bacterium]
MKDIDMTKGRILPSVIAYIIPLILANLLQVFYNTADTIVLANFAEKSAFTSVGATTALLSVLVSAVTNLSAGAELIIARYLGGNEKESVKKAIHTAALFSVLLGFGLIALGQSVAVPLLRFTKCPEEYIPGAALYLRIYFCGVPELMYYSFMAPVLRCKGDTKRPLIYLAVSGAVNVVLNIVFVALFHWDIVGVGVATVISQILSMVLITAHLTSLKDVCRLSPSKLRIHKSELIRILKYGLPSVIQSLAYVVSNLQIQSAINGFGNAGIDGNAASSQIEGFVNAFYFSVGVATLAFLSQNIGAGKRERVFKVLRANYALGIGMAFVISGAVLLLKDPLLTVFLPDKPEALAFASVRAYCVIGATALGSFNNISAAVLQSYGYTKTSMIASLVGICGFRILWMTFVFPSVPTVWGLYICYPISWFLFGIGLSILLVWILKRYKAGAEFGI